MIDLGSAIVLIMRTVFCLVAEKNVSHENAEGGEDGDDSCTKKFNMYSIPYLEKQMEMCLAW